MFTYPQYTSWMHRNPSFEFMHSHMWMHNASTMFWCPDIGCDIVMCSIPALWLVVILDETLSCVLSLPSDWLWYWMWHCHVFYPCPLIGCDIGCDIVMCSIPALWLVVVSIQVDCELIELKLNIFLYINSVHVTLDLCQYIFFQVFCQLVIAGQWSFTYLLIYVQDYFLIQFPVFYSVFVHGSDLNPAATISYLYSFPSSVWNGWFENLLIFLQIIYKIVYYQLYGILSLFSLCFFFHLICAVVIWWNLYVMQHIFRWIHLMVDERFILYLIDRLASTGWCGEVQDPIHIKLQKKWFKSSFKILFLLNVPLQNQHKIHPYIEL